MKKLLSIILTIALLLTLAPLNTQAAKPKITYKKLTMITGDTFSGLYLKNGYVKSMKSSNKKVVSVDEYGNLKAKKAGTATITLKDYNKKSYKCKVTVYDKNTIKEQITSERVTFMEDEESTTYYIVTNNSPATLDIDVSISGKTLTGETKMDSDSFYGVPTSGVFIVEAGYKCTSASLKYNVSISGYKDMSQYVDISVKKQSTNALVTINNNSSKQLSVNAFVVGYDSSGSVISINRFYEYIDGNDYEKTNISYNYEEVKVYDEEDGWDYEERYFVPATYKYFVIAHS